MVIIWPQHHSFPLCCTTHIHTELSLTALFRIAHNANSNKLTMGPRAKRGAAKAAEEKPQDKKAKSGLAVGDELPSFELESDEGNTLASSDLVKDNGIVLFAYPKANTKGCTSQAVGLSEKAEELAAAGFKVFGISADKPKSQANWRSKEGIKFNLLCDPSYEVLAKLGFASGKKISRSHIVVAKGGKVLDVQYGITPKSSVKDAVEFCLANKGEAVPDAAAEKSADEDEAAEQAEEAAEAGEQQEKDEEMKEGEKEKAAEEQGDDEAQEAGDKAAAMEVDAPAAEEQAAEAGAEEAAPAEDAEKEVEAEKPAADEPAAAAEEPAQAEAAENKPAEEAAATEPAADDKAAEEAKPAEEQPAAEADDKPAEEPAAAAEAADAPAEDVPAEAEGEKTAAVAAAADEAPAVDQAA